ncbi:hypothetical protein [Coleofasciculus sp. FACHB-129]|nr:hypothetical protein [Coleofasciculus sp. FACHB-129]MBD1896695.1 hypothetical protein [Coleofasciculus sp. FACHB-129]
MVTVVRSHSFSTSPRKCDRIFYNSSRTARSHIEDRLFYLFQELIQLIKA